MRTGSQASPDSYDMSSEKPVELLYLLSSRGWTLGENLSDPSPTAVKQAISSYQHWWGLKEDGWAGPITERHLEQPRFCGNSDRCESNTGVGRLAKFDRQKISWAVTQFPRGTNSSHQEAIVAAFAKAWGHWASVCGIVPSKEGRAIVRSDFQRIDRRGGTLAWSELAPLSGRSFLQQRYDILEPWYVGDGNPEQGQIDLVAVACHEIGHALGIGHIRGNTGDLMNPIYNPDVRSPQRGDIGAATDRYGPPIPDLLTPDDASADIHLVIEGVGEFSGHVDKLR